MILFDMPLDVNGDELPPIWQYVPQPKAEDNRTTIIAAACAGACAVIAVMLVLVNVMRRN